MNEVGHDRTTLEFRKATWDLQEDRRAIISVEYANAGIALAKPIRLDDPYRVVEAISGTELFRTVPVPTVSIREHELLMERGFAEYDRLWKELAGM